MLVAQNCYCSTLEDVYRHCKRSTICYLYICSWSFWLHISLVKFCIDLAVRCNTYRLESCRSLVDLAVMKTDGPLVQLAACSKPFSPDTLVSSWRSWRHKSSQLQMWILHSSYYHYCYRITSQHHGPFIAASMLRENATSPLTERFMTEMQPHRHVGQLSLAASGLAVACYV